VVVRGKGQNQKTKKAANNMEEKDKKCCICGRDIHGDEYCLFHFKSPSKNVQLFQSKLTEIFRDKSLEIYDLSRFVFPRGIWFPEKIDKEIIFREAVFHEELLFMFTTFKKLVDFSGAIFKGEADFRGSVFEKEAFANFGEAIFEGKANFSIAFFKDQANFSEVIFNKEVFFYETFFEDGVTFYLATFKDRLVIQGHRINKLFSKREVNFKEVSLMRPEKVSFQKVDLCNFRLLGTDLRKVEFVDVDWYKEKARGRNKIYDEVSPDPETKKFDYPLIAQVYKRLRANYEENLNYADAGDFHIGEMEMRRKGEKNPFNKAVIWLYKLISNYGESYWHPLVWILFFLIFFPLIYMLTGITPKIGGSQIQYHLDFSLKGIIPTFEKIKDYWSSFVYSLSVFSLIRERPYQTIRDLGHFFTILESIFSPVLIAFFLLALRRRFKR
jgi:uncharacterized protein YjbI with pentapeptide repeats